jgi:hypothetical protein
LPVIWRTPLVALAAVAPFRLAGIGESSFTWPSLLAVAAPGTVGTVLAFVAVTTLVGRVGSTRGSHHPLPGVAIGLGVIIRRDTITALPVIGTIIVPIGADPTAAGHRRSDTDRPRWRSLTREQAAIPCKPSHYPSTLTRIAVTGLPASSPGVRADAVTSLMHR